jgi:glutathione synthase/RimK-type ligase-like ATP-grasp enzyme
MLDEEGMRRRLLVTGAGSGASNNLIRSLRAGEPSVHVVGCNDDRFVLKKSTADRKYLVPRPTDPRYVDALRRVIDSEHIHLVIPTGDADVKALSDARRRLVGRLFLPARAVVDLCRDKYELTRFLADRRLPVPETYPVKGLKSVDRIFTRFGPRRPLWCRARTGSRSLGAAPVTSPAQARAWMEQWAELRGVPVQAFTLSEYLPGRDFLCQSVWHQGGMVLCSTFERLAYFGGENSPSGVSSLSSLAKTVVDQRVVEICRRVVTAVAPGAAGAFSIDLKENSAATPCVTEINAGRFFIGMTAFDSVLKHNMPLTFVRVALGEPLELREEYDVVDDHYLVRDLDTLPGVFHSDDLFDGIETA